MRHFSFIRSSLARPIVGALVFALVSCSIGCTEDEIDPNNGSGQECADGERFNPILGACEALPTGDNNGLLDMEQPTCPPGQRFSFGLGRCVDDGSNNTTPGDMGPDMTTPPDMPVDDDMSGPCVTSRDDDNDGLNNRCECLLGTRFDVVDSDGDGLTDSEEDADGDCGLTRGPDGAPIETDPRTADTDGDGLNDGDEVMAMTNPLRIDSDGDGIDDNIEVATCLNPLEEDTDSDTIPDGVEDGDFDGEIGDCVNRMYDPACARGESDPCQADTDGDGTPDNQEVQFRACRPEDTANLPTPVIVSDMAGDYQLVVEAGLVSSKVTVGTGSLDAHVFEDTANGFTGFIASLPTPTMTTDASALSGSVVTALQGTPAYASSIGRSSGRLNATHDGFDAVSAAIVDLPANTALNTARDEILAQLASTTTANLTTGLTSNFPGSATDPTLLVYQVVSRSPSNYIVVGVLVNLADYLDKTKSTGFLVDDLTGGSSLARFDETLETDCVSYTVSTRPKVDIIIALDNSGSMGDERMSLVNFASEFTTLLNNANLDWRIGVTGVGCANIKSDMSLSAEFRNLWPAGGGFLPTGACSAPIGLPGGGGNGSLIGGTFVDSMTPNVVSTIQSRLNSVPGDNSEYSFTMGVAAIDRALPRQDGVDAKIRTDSSVVMIFLTDENDEFFDSELSWLSGAMGPLSPAQQTELEMATQPWIDFLAKPDIGATVFGLYPPPGEVCMTAGDVGFEFAELVTATGGNGGSVCQANISNTLRTIADATAGLSSALRLRGVPVSPTIQVKLGAVATGMISDVVRSRSDGFDYDPVVNRISFFGPTPPQTGDRAVIPYRRWANSVIACVTEEDCPNSPTRKFKCVAGTCR